MPNFYPDQLDFNENKKGWELFYDYIRKNTKN